MLLRELKLENFRLFSQVEIVFSEEVNIITGLNGQGKTSILEAVYYTALTKSFRTKNDRYAIQYDKDHFTINTSYITDAEALSKTRIYYSVPDGKHLFLDEKEIYRFSEYIGTIPCVLLTLDDLKLTQGGPAERRRFLDILLSQVSPVYLDNLKNYRRILMQRNALLMQSAGKDIWKEMETWNDQLVEHGTAIMLKRLDLIDYLNLHLEKQYNRFTQNNENITVRYQSALDPELGNLTEQFYNRLRRAYPQEKKRAMSLVGPHRDDIEFYKDGKSFREYGSQGENKTLVIAIKFSEWEYLSHYRNTKPILLLDDIFGELDQYRMQALVEVLNTIGQAFITTTMTSFPHQGRKINVGNGMVFYG